MTELGLSNYKVPTVVRYVNTTYISISSLLWCFYLMRVGRTGRSVCVCAWLDINDWLKLKPVTDLPFIKASRQHFCLCKVDILFRVCWKRSNYKWINGCVGFFSSLILCLFEFKLLTAKLACNKLQWLLYMYVKCSAEMFVAIS